MKKQWSRRKRRRISWELFDTCLDLLLDRDYSSVIAGPSAIEKKMQENYLRQVQVDKK